VPLLRNLQRSDLPFQLGESQSEHIGQWATPHHFSDVRRGAPSWIWDYLAQSPVRRNWPSSSDCALKTTPCLFSVVRNCRTAFVGFRKNLSIFQRRRFRLDISFHLIHPRHDRRLGGIGRVVPIGENLCHHTEIFPDLEGFDFFIFVQ